MVYRAINRGARGSNQMTAAVPLCGTVSLYRSSVSSRRTSRLMAADDRIARPCRKSGTAAVILLTRSSPILSPVTILSPWQCERNHAGKDFFIIVN